MSKRRFGNVNDIVAFAIDREIDAADGYGRLAALAKTPGMKDLLLELKGEEEDHRKLLENMSGAELRKVPLPRVEDLGLSDALADEPIASDMTFQDLLIFAARKEKRAEELYTGLARISQLSSHRHVLEFLAGQERIHKLKLETEYEKHILQED